MTIEPRKLTALAVAGCAALALLTGCGISSPTAETTNNKRVYEDHIKLEDGRTVTCLVYAAGNKGGLNCDWENAK
jgi:uncharacterized lipoprotein YajG